MSNATDLTDSCIHVECGKNVYEKLLTLLLMVKVTIMNKQQLSDTFKRHPRQNTIINVNVYFFGSA